MNKWILIAALTIGFLIIGLLVGFEGIETNDELIENGWIKEPACATGFRYRTIDYCVVENKVLAEDYTYVSEGYYD